MPDDAPARRPPRLAFLTLPGLGHFAPDLLRALPQPGVLEVRHVEVRDPRRDLAAALAWTDDPSRDAVWFEFCWPPFPQLIAETDFAGRRVVVRVHRVEAFDTPYAAEAPWHKVDDCVAVAEAVAARLRAVAPHLEETTRLSVVHNGVDLDRHAPAAAPHDPFRIGWCGWLSLRKNPSLAVQVLHRLRALDRRYTLHMAVKSAAGSEPVAVESLLRLIRRLGLEDAVHILEGIPPERMPEWHARNAVLLSTSLHESFGYAIAEAAAMGCDLAVLDFPGAEEFWPEAVRFGTVEEAVALIRAARPHRWRGLIESRFSLAAQVRALRALLLGPRRAPRGAAVPQVIGIAHGAWRGRFLLRDRGDHIQRVVAATGGFYEAEMLEDLRARLPAGALFVDVGANLGNHALFAAGVCGARVIAVEPAPELAAHCRENATLNGLADRVEVVERGLGEAPGRAAVLPGPAGNAGMARLAPSPEGAVEVLRLDDLLAARGDPAPAVVKIDVEGMEAAVLRGAAETLRRHRPVLYVETATAGDFLEVREILAPLGYAPAAQFNATPTWLFLAKEAGAAATPQAAA